VVGVVGADRARADLTVRVIEDPADLLARQPEWDGLVAALERPRYSQPADAIASTVGERTDRTLVAICLEDEDGRLVAAAAFLREGWNVDWRIRTHRRRHRLLRVPVTSAYFLGGGFLGPDDADVQRRLLEAVAEELTDVEVIRFVHVDTASLLWSMLTAREPSLAGRWTWHPVDPIPGLAIRLAGSADEYWQAQIGRKSRANFVREWRLLQEAAGGDLRVEVTTEPERVPQFLAACEVVHERSWHAKAGAALLRPTEDRIEQQAHLARHGRLRGYVLYAEGRPIAFVQAYRIGGTCTLIRMAFDDAWAARSPGKALLRQVINDVHADPGIDHLDFGHGVWPYKQVLANEAKASSDALLVRRSVRNGLAFSGPMAWSAIKRRGLAAVNRSGRLEQLQAWSRKRMAR
jgi:hypothetical protein